VFSGPEGFYHVFGACIGAVMKEKHIRFRQVHLDFHTSPECKHVGDDFDPKIFVETLQQAHVNAINIFSKCHHGYSYYPTKVGTMHPHLSFDLLGQQIEALHHAGMLCPIYYSIRWDELAGQQHPEWVVVDKEGRVVTRPPLSGDTGWTTLDMASGYSDYVMAQVEEIGAWYEVDGFWFDICFPLPNYSLWAQAEMRKAGVRMDDDNAVWAYAQQAQEHVFEKLTRLVHNTAPEATLFYNGTIGRDMRRVIPYMTHLEVESLPTTAHWGYLHFPIMARQARTYGKEFLGMNGRFHNFWGDFGGLKTQDQLDHECGTVIAAGGKLSVGDQLHPRGVLDPAVYRLIGRTIQRIEALEPWLVEAKPATEAAILGLGPASPLHHGIGAHSADVEGAAQILLEAGIQFDIIDEQGDLSLYEAVILPDQTVLEADLRVRLESYLASGGRLILSGTAALAADQTFQLADIPVQYIRPAPTTPSYLRLDRTLLGISELTDDYDYVFYDQAHVVRAAAGATVYGDIRSALFNRTWEHFISHQHAPVGDSLKAPIMVRKNNVLYFAAPLFSAYRHHDYWVYRAVAQKALADFLPPTLLRPTGPGWAEFSLHTQPACEHHPERRIVHIVTYHPRRTMQPIQHVDQSWTTSGLAVAIRTERVPQRVYLAPGKESLSFTMQDGYVHIALPPVGVHTVVVME
jgi:hypothetical protein